MAYHHRPCRRSGSFRSGWAPALGCASTLRLVPPMDAALLAEPEAHAGSASGARPHDSHDADYNRAVNGLIRSALQRSGPAAAADNPASAIHFTWESTRFDPDLLAHRQARPAADSVGSTITLSLDQHQLSALVCQLRPEHRQLVFALPASVPLHLHLLLEAEWTHFAHFRDREPDCINETLLQLCAFSKLAESEIGRSLDLAGLRLLRYSTSTHMRWRIHVPREAFQDRRHLSCFLDRFRQYLERQQSMREAQEERLECDDIDVSEEENGDPRASHDGLELCVSNPHLQLQQQAAAAASASPIDLHRSMYRHVVQDHVALDPSQSLVPITLFVPACFADDPASASSRPHQEEMAPALRVSNSSSIPQVAVFAPPVHPKTSRSTARDDPSVLPSSWHTRYRHSLLDGQHQIDDEQLADLCFACHPAWAMPSTQAGYRFLTLEPRNGRSSKRKQPAADSERSSSPRQSSHSSQSLSHRAQRHSAADRSPAAAFHSEPDLDHDPDDPALASACRLSQQEWRAAHYVLGGIIHPAELQQESHRLIKVGDEDDFLPLADLNLACEVTATHRDPARRACFTVSGSFICPVLLQSMKRWAPAAEANDIVQSLHAAGLMNVTLEVGHMTLKCRDCHSSAAHTRIEWSLQHAEWLLLLGGDHPTVAAMRIAASTRIADDALMSSDRAVFRPQSCKMLCTTESTQDQLAPSDAMAVDSRVKPQPSPCREIDVPLNNQWQDSADEDSNGLPTHTCIVWMRAWHAG